MAADPLSLDTAVDAALAKLRRQLFEKGISGTNGLARAFKTADFNGNKKLDPEEFVEALQFAGLFLPAREVSALFRKFDRSRDGSIDYDEFLRGVKGDLNERREAIVRKAFNKLDRDGSGVVTLEDLAGIYNASKHPDVATGKVTEEKVLTDFLNSFAGASGAASGTVTFDEFKDYYGDVGACIPSDDFFVEMIESCWMITESAPTAELEAKIASYAELLREKVRQKCRTADGESKLLRQTFQFFDSDESGAVTIDEFGRAMERLGIPLQRKETSLFFSKFDPDNSGTITYDEFVTYVYGA